MITNITTHYKPLSKLKHRCRELVATTNGKREPNEYRNYISRMSFMGLHMCYAQAHGNIISTIGFMTEVGVTGFTKSEEMLAATKALNIDPTKVQVRSCIYTRKDYQRQGIADMLEKKANEISLKLGFEYRAAYAYQNEEIYNWIHRHGNAIDLNMLEPTGTGFPATLVPLTNL